MKKGIYLDNSTVAQPSEKAISQMIPYLTEKWGSPSAPHQMGQELFPAMESSYRAIYHLLGAKDKGTFIFTSSGAEAINHLFFSAYENITHLTGKNQFVISAIDEAPSILSLSRLEKLGCVAKMAPVSPKGYTSIEALAESITPRTALVSLSWANGLTGVINPVAEIGALCKERGICFHLDATHILGKLFFSLDDIGADILTFNGEPLHAPQGTGGIYTKEEIRLSPFIVGGSEQGGLRAGSLNVPSLIALGYVAKEALDNRDLLCTETARLRDKLEKGILSGFPDALPFFRDQERLPHCTAIAFPGIANEAMLYALNRKGVYASIGGGHFQQIGLILEASGITPVVAHTAISFSLSRSTYDEEIERAIEIIIETAKQLRNLSKKLL